MKNKKFKYKVIGSSKVFVSRGSRNILEKIGMVVFEDLRCYKELVLLERGKGVYFKM